MREANEGSLPQRHARWLRLSRVLAFLPVGAVTAGMPYCGNPCYRVPVDPDARYADGAVVPAEVQERNAMRCSGSGPLAPPECDA